MTIKIRHIETPSGLKAVEALQRQVWNTSDVEVVPTHTLLAIVHGGGLIIGAFDDDRLVGFVLGFTGFDPKNSGEKMWHCSHMAGVHPDYRDCGLGFQLKRAQWQMVRQQGLSRITWTYDPLQSRNAKLNISKLGTICNNYLPNYYGELKDQFNRGLPTDRFRVDWWINSVRVKRRLGKSPPKRLDLVHYLSADATRLNETKLNESGFITPLSTYNSIVSDALLIFEIPANFPKIKEVDLDLALEWRLHSRSIFQDAFRKGYIVTDFVFLPGSHPRSYYVLSNGDSTL